MESGNEFDDELLEAIKEKTRLENRIKHYSAIFPDYLTMLETNFDISHEEACYIIYCSEEVFTTSILDENLHMARIKDIGSSMLLARDTFDISLSEQLDLIKVISECRRTLRNRFRYNTDRGYPKDIVQTHLIITVLYQFFELLLDRSLSPAIAWLISVFPFTFNGKIEENTHTAAVAEFGTQKLDKTCFYITGRAIMRALDLKLKQKELISTSVFDSQVIKTDTALVYGIKTGDEISSILYESDSLWVNNELALSEDKIKKFIKILERRHRYFPTNNEDMANERISFFHSQSRSSEMQEISSQFVIISHFESKFLCYFLHTSKIEDINYTQIKSFLDRNILQLQTIPSDKLSIVLLEWVNYLQIISTIQSFTIMDSSDLGIFDTQRDRSWSFDALALSEDIRETKNTELYYLGQKTSDKSEDLHRNLVELCQGIKTMIFPDGKLEHTEVLPKECLSMEKTVEEERFHYLLYAHERNSTAFIILHDKRPFDPPVHYFHKSDNLKLQVLQMRLADLVHTRVEGDRLDWIRHRLGINTQFMELTQIELPYIQRVPEKSLLERREEILQGQEGNISTVSQRLMAIQGGTANKIELQTLLYKFIVESVKEHISLNLLNNRKIADFVDSDYRSDEIVKGNSKIETLKDSFDIYKLTGGIGNSALDVINTLDTLVNRNLNEALFKLVTLESQISKLSKEHLESILQHLKGNIDLK